MLNEMRNNNVVMNNLASLLVKYRCESVALRQKKYKQRKIH